MKLETELPSGSLKQHGSGFNAKSDDQEVAVTTAFYNQPLELERRFFGKNPGTLLKIPFPDGGEIRLHQATGPYTPYGLMVIARRPGLEKKTEPFDYQRLSDTDEPVEAKILHDYPEEQQIAYLQVMESVNKAYREILGPEYIIFTGGNWLKDYSNFKTRNSRTIAEAHDHFCVIDKKQIERYEKGGLETNEIFTKERDLTKRLLENGLPRIQKALPDDSPLQLHPRKKLPYGYSFVVPADADVKTFARFLREHHEAYSSVAETMSSRYGKRDETIVTQPSYQFFMEHDADGNRHISISPSFAGPIGVLESAGIQSLRDPEYKTLVDPEEVDRIQRHVAAIVKNETAKQFATV